MKELKRFFLFLGLFLLLERPCHWATHGFNVGRIMGDLQVEERWETVLEPVPREAIGKKYRLLSSGAQIYAFESEDREHVIKFIKFHHLRIPNIFSYIPISDNRLQKKLAKRQKKKEELFESFTIAMNSLKNETGLIAAHLNPTNDPLPITLLDKNGIAHNVDIAKTAFVVQKRATLAYPHILLSWKEGKGEEAISLLVELLKKRCQKGIFDKDPDIRTNFGFIEDRAIEIDVGRFSYSKKEKVRHQYCREIYRATRDMRSWLTKNCPELVATLDEKVMEL